MNLRSFLKNRNLNISDYLKTILNFDLSYGFNKFLERKRKNFLLIIDSFELANNEIVKLDEFFMDAIYKSGVSCIVVETSGKR